MPQQLIFSDNGVELLFSLEEGDARATVLLKVEGKEAKEFDLQSLSAFQAFISQAVYYLRLVKLNYKSGVEADKNNQEVLRIVQTVFEQHFSKSVQSQKTIQYQISPSLKAWNNTDDDRIRASVFIGLPEEQIDIFTIERIQNATGNFMEALGFELEALDEPVYGSFFQSFIYLLKSAIKYKPSRLYKKAKEEIEKQLKEGINTQSTSELTLATATLIASLTGVNEAVVRIDSILIVKVTRDGSVSIIVETISPELSALLNKSPSLLENSNIIFDLIMGMRVPDKTVKESGSAEIS